MGSEGAAVSVERPIFACKAHVFHIDPKTKRSWLSASTTSINVTMFYDSARGLYRIISMEGTKALINSTVTPNMVFTKTSQKFGQWSDVRANTVYGLGFESEFALNKFIEKFNEIKEAIRVASPNDTGQQIGTTPTCCPVSGLTPSLAGMNVNNNVSANASPLSSRSNVPFADPGVIDPPNMQPTTPNSMPPPATAVSCDENDSESKSDHKTNHQNRNAAITTAQTDSPKHQVVDSKAPPVPPLPSQAALSAAESQLKYENDRLKLALAHSSANAKKWEIELATLKNNNQRLTSALQESTANVDEWKKQLQSYKEENQRLKNKYLDLEAHKGGSEGTPELRKELDVLRTRADNLEKELKAKDENIKKLSRAEGQIEDRFKALMGEHAELQATLGLTHSQLEMAMAAQESQRRVIETLNAQLASRIQELANIHRELNTALQI